MSIDITHIEQIRLNVQKNINQSYSLREKLSAISNYFIELIQTSDSKIIDAYIPEFIDVFIKAISRYEVSGIHPDYSRKLGDIISKLIHCGLPEPYILKLIELKKNLKQKILLLDSCLNGSGFNNSEKVEISFPVLEKTSAKEFSESGFLESISIHFKKTSVEQKFSVSPSADELDSRLEKQLYHSWAVAKRIAGKYTKRKISNFYIHVEFEKKFGHYEGNSVGLLLTISFLEHLLKFYNARISITFKEGLAITGGITESGDIPDIDKSLIAKKVKVVFYSCVKYLVVPKKNETDTITQLKQLHHRFPSRDLKIISISDINDLLDRRALIDIRRINPVVRTAKVVRKHWLSSTLLLIIIGLIYTTGFWDFDRNPVLFEHQGNDLLIKNVNRKTLWTVRINFNKENSYGNYSRMCKKLVDVNNDGINEVILAEEEFPAGNTQRGRIVCFDNNKNLLWQYKFRDTVSTFRTWTDFYSSSIIDTITIENRLILIAMARNEPNWPNAVYKLDVKTGERFDSVNTFWHTGGITNGIIGDFDENGKPDIILTGLNNGYERAVIFSIDIENLNGQSPSPDRYRLNGKNTAKLNKYILLPHTDYGKHFFRYNVVRPGWFNYYQDSGEILFITHEGSDKPILFNYRFDKNLNLLWVDCGDDAQIARDSLVARGVLNEPYTNTNEYFKILKEQIEYWDGTKFVTSEEFKK